MTGVLGGQLPREGVEVDDEVEVAGDGGIIGYSVMRQGRASAKGLYTATYICHDVSLGSLDSLGHNAEPAVPR